METDMNRQLPSSIFHPRSILVRGTNWLGDAVMTTPALLRLREKFPDACIVLLTPEKLRDLWRGHPTINETIAIAPGEGLFSVARKLRRWGTFPSNDSSAPAVPSPLPSDGRGEGQGEVRVGVKGKFDLALTLPNSPRSALEIWLAGVPQRIGYARPWRNFFLTQRIPPRPDAVKMRKRSLTEIQQLIADKKIANRQSPIGNPLAHQVHDFLHLVAALGANPQPVPPQLWIAPDEMAAAEQKFGLAGITQPVLGMNPGAEYGPAKRWPAERFIAAAREIQTRTNCAWILFGGANDVQIASQIESAIRHSTSVIHNLAGQTSLRELMALLKHCRVLLTNDSGPMHVAAALGTPVVAPFGSTSPELTGPCVPGDPRHRLLKSDAPCAPCFLRECPIDFRCMNGISVQRVVEAVLSLI
jgi:heptosyltransferase-2